MSEGTFHSSRKLFRRRKICFARTKISKKSLCRRNRFSPNIVKMGVILVICWPFEDLQDFEDRHASSEVPIWRSCEFLSVTSRFVLKNYPRHSEIHLSRILGGGVKLSISICSLTFWPKPTCAFLLADMMM